MATPTQAYPPWLEPTLVTATQDGSVVVETSVVQLPQTYYGPSIPLGTNWVYGGSTFPASIATSFSFASTPAPSAPTATLPPTSPPAIPPTSRSTLTQVATSSPVPSTASTSSPSVSSTTPTSSAPLLSTTLTSSSSSATNPSNSLTPPVSEKKSGPSGTLLAVTLSTVLGVVMIIALLAVVFRLRRRVQRRHQRVRGRGITWSMINESLARRYAEGGDEEGAEGAEGAEGEGAAGEQTAFLGGERVMQQRHQGPASVRVLSDAPRDRPVVPEPLVLANGSQPASRGSDSSTLDSDAKREDIARFNASTSTADGGSLFFNGGDNREGDSSRQAADEGAAGSARAGEPSRSYSGDYAPRPPGAAAPRVPSLISAHRPSPPNDDDARYDDLYGRASLDVEGPPPPRRRDGDTTRSLQRRTSGVRTYPDSPPSEADERATLLAAHPGASPPGSPVHASPEEKTKFEELPTSPTLEDIEMEQGFLNPPPRRSVSPASWSVSMGGLAGLAKGLGRLSWFRRMSFGAGPSGTRHSSPSSPSRSRRGGDSRPSSATGMPSPRLRPPFGARPQSGVSFRSIDAELGLRPPGMRLSAAGSGTGSGSGKSGASVYHSASSRPRTPQYAVGDRPVSPERPISDVGPTILYIPPGIDLGLAEGTSTIRAIDLLDLPVPEPALPFDRPVAPPPDSSSRSTQHSVASSKGTAGTGLAFPPGLVSVTKWDSTSGSFTREVKDALEDAPPQAGGEWSSLRSKKSTSDVGDEAADPDQQQSEGMVTRSSTEGQAVQVVAREHTASETASIGTSPRPPAPGPRHLPSTSISSRSLRGFGITLTPRVSAHELSQSDVASHSANGSYSSQRSHPASHSQGASHHSSNKDSEDGHPPSPPAPQGTGFNRASLTAIGGEGGGPLQMSPLRAVTAPVLEPTVEDRETSESSYSNPETKGG